MNKCIDFETLSNGHLLSSDIKEITIPSHLSKTSYLKLIFQFLKKNSFIKKVSICDDYLAPSDVDTKYFCERVFQDLPATRINWIREMKVDGRHGR